MCVPMLAITLICICICNSVVKKSKVGKAGPIVEKPPLYVEKDPHKLVNYVCGSNIYIDGEDVKVNGSCLNEKKKIRRENQLIFLNLQI